MLSITVRQLDGLEFPLQFNSGISVFELKKLIRPQLRGKEVLPGGKLLLVYQGLVLNEETIVDEIGLQPNDHIVAFHTHKAFLYPGAYASPAPSPSRRRARKAVASTLSGCTTTAKLDDEDCQLKTSRALPDFTSSCFTAKLSSDSAHRSSTAIQSESSTTESDVFSVPSGTTAPADDSNRTSIRLHNKLQSSTLSQIVSHSSRSATLNIAPADSTKATTHSVRHHGTSSLTQPPSSSGPDLATSRTGNITSDSPFTHQSSSGHNQAQTNPHPDSHSASSPQPSSTTPMSAAAKTRSARKENQRQQKAMEEDALPQAASRRTRKKTETTDLSQEFSVNKELYPLPQAWEDLCGLFVAVNTVVGFACRHDAHMRFEVLAEAVRGLVPTPLTQTHLQQMAAVVPHLLRLQMQILDDDIASPAVVAFLTSGNTTEDIAPESQECSSKKRKKKAPSDFVFGSRPSLAKIGAAIDSRSREFRSVLENKVRETHSAFLNARGLIPPVEPRWHCDFYPDRHVDVDLPLADIVSREDPDVTEGFDLSDAWCSDRTPINAEDLLEHIRSLDAYRGQIVHVQRTAARDASYGSLGYKLHPDLQAVLETRGFSRLFSHQAKAVTELMDGAHVVVATSTSSGKSLCYNIPTLNAVLRDKDVRALYMFPTKALAQDQLRGLQSLCPGLPMRVHAYDGDTPFHTRADIREHAAVLLTNPDMLHMSMLPIHRDFAVFFRNLRYVVIDEMHAYKGIFGTHVALVLRRLQRVCSIYGSRPQFVFCSATVAQPGQHARNLACLPAGDRVVVVDQDGSPCGPKLFVLWNPPIIKGTDGQFKRRSPAVEMTRLMAELVRHGVRSLAFLSSRKQTERVVSMLQAELAVCAADTVHKVQSYRSGYTHADRRALETQMFNDELLGVVATNALELGVDIGSLDATLHLGFMGTVASMWQQAGRAGRREQPAMGIYVGFSSPVDQYFMRNPDRLFAITLESACIDPSNLQLLRQHVLCAAFESPLVLSADAHFFGDEFRGATAQLEAEELLQARASADGKVAVVFTGDKAPAADVSLRAMNALFYSVVVDGSNKLLEQVEDAKAIFEVYDGAVYLHQGKQYLVKSLDLPSRTATVRPSNVNYFTKVRDSTFFDAFGHSVEFVSEEHDSMKAFFGPVRMTITVFGFRKIWKKSMVPFENVDLFLPETKYETMGAWLPLPQDLEMKMIRQDLDFRAGKHGVAHAVLNLLPLHVTCCAADLRMECVSEGEARFRPFRVMFADAAPGGMGIAKQAYTLLPRLMFEALGVVEACECKDARGCPSCIQHFNCGEHNEILDKNASLFILRAVCSRPPICSEVSGV